MSTTTTPQPVSIIISESTTTQQLTSSKHNSTLDDYFRLVSSQAGKYMASITNAKQLTMFDMQLQSSIGNFTVENSTFIAFSQKQDMFAVTTRVPSIRFYQIVQSQTLGKTIVFTKEMKPNVLSASLGWITWSLDNKFVFYTKNTQIYMMDVVSFEEKILSKDSTIKSRCAPYYLVMDRQGKELFSSSRAGTICKYSISIYDPQSTDPFTPQLSLLQTTTLLSPSAMIIASVDQSSTYLIVSTSRITQSTQSFYSSYIISKSNINFYQKVNLQQQLIAPPLIIVAQNYENYLLAFLKGEKSLYLYSLDDIQQPLVQESYLLYTDVKQLNYLQKLDMPFLMHTINYNRISKKLMLGISNPKNQDKIITMDLNFNCSQIYYTNQSSQLKPLCTQECNLLNKQSSFSISQRQCVNQSVQQKETEISCSELSVTKPYYTWNYFDNSCELNCQNVPNSLSQLSYNTPQECYCQQNYIWYTKTSECLTQQQITLKQTITIVDNTPPPINQSLPLPLPLPSNTTTIPNNNIDNQPQNQTVIPSQNSQASQSSSSAVGIVVPIVVVLGMIGIVWLIYLYKYKKLCFRNNSTQQVKENPSNLYEIKSSSTEQKDTGSNEKITSKIFEINSNFSDNINIQPPIYEEEIRTDSNDNDNDYEVRADSERKF